MQKNRLPRELKPVGRLHRTMYNVTDVLGLTTGIGVIAWGVWGLVSTLATFFYEETGLSVEEILISNAFNEGLLLSAVVIALGVIILELKKIQDLMIDDVNQRVDNSSGETRVLPEKSGTTT